MANKSLVARVGGHIWQWNNFRPPCKTVDDRQEVSASIGEGQGAYQIDVDGFKPTRSRRNDDHRSLGVARYFAHLALWTRAAPVPDSLVEPRPNEARRYELDGGAMTEIVDGFKHLPSV